MIKSVNIRVGCVAAALLVSAAAMAGETVTYTYDARGRLIKVDHAGTVNHGVSTAYTLDKADNRTNKTTTGATPPSPSLSLGNTSTTEAGHLSFTAAGSVDDASRGNDPVIPFIDPLTSPAWLGLTTVVVRPTSNDLYVAGDHDKPHRKHAATIYKIKR